MNLDNKNKVTLTNFVQGFYDKQEKLMIDCMTKGIFSNKRQLLYIFQILSRYIKKKENPKLYSQDGKVIYIISGRTSPTL